jgi:hypothetical protein
MWLRISSDFVEHVFATVIAAVTSNVGTIAPF